MPEAIGTERPARAGPRRRGRRPGLPMLTIGALPVALTGMNVLLHDDGSAIKSDVVYILLAVVTLMAAGFLMAVLGLLLFVLMDRERTERLVMILKADTDRRKRRRRRRRTRD